MYKDEPQPITEQEHQRRMQQLFQAMAEVNDITANEAELLVTIEQALLEQELRGDFLLPSELAAAVNRYYAKRQLGKSVTAEQIQELLEHLCADTFHWYSLHIAIQQYEDDDGNTIYQFADDREEDVEFSWDELLNIRMRDPRWDVAEVRRLL